MKAVLRGYFKALSAYLKNSHPLFNVKPQQTSILKEVIGAPVTVVMTAIFREQCPTTKCFENQFSLLVKNFPILS